MGVLLIISHDMIKCFPDFSAKLIDDVIEYYQTVVSMFNGYGYKAISASFVNNFKDTLMHYKQLCDQYSKTSENSEDAAAYQSRLNIVLQFEMLLEHLNRGVVDVHVELLQGAIEFHIQILSQIAKAGEKMKRYSWYVLEIQRHMTQLKEHIYAIRVSRMEIVRIASQNGDSPQINNDCLVKLEAACKCTKDCLEYIFNANDDKLLKQVYDTILEYNQKTIPKNVRVLISEQ